MRRWTLDVLAITQVSMGRRPPPPAGDECDAASPFKPDARVGGLAGRTGAAILAGMAYEYRVTEAEDGTFPVELWSSKGGRETLVYRTPGFQTRELAEAWIVPVEVQSATGDPPQPRARVTYLKPRRSRVVIVSKPDPLPPHASPPALPDS